MEAFSSPNAPKAIGPYSPAVRAGQLLFISGQVPIDPATGSWSPETSRTQTRRVMDNIGALLTAGGLDFSAVVRTTVFLADMNDFAAMNEVYATLFHRAVSRRERRSRSRGCRVTRASKST